MISDIQKKIVILEKDHVQRDFLRSVISSESDLAFCFDRVASCFDNLAQLDPDLIVVGSFPRKSILRFINAHKATNCNLPSLLITQDVEIKKYLEINGVSSIRMYDSDLIYSTFNKSIANALKQHEETSFDKDNPFIVGNSPDIVKVKEILSGLKMSRESVLIEGERGTGKEMIARAIHRLSGSHDLFFKISARDILKDSKRLGLTEIIGKTIRSKHKEIEHQTISETTATIFVHEVGYLSHSVQSELLLMLENGSDPFNTLSPKKLRRFRIISSTSLDTDYLLSENRLRKDLFYRLNVINMNVAPLRERKEDIPLLVDYFFYRYCKMLGRSFFELPGDTIDLFNDYHWPGNTKELESVVKRAVTNGEDGKFLKEMDLINKKTISKTHQMMIEGLKISNTIADTKEYLQQIEKKSLKEICSKFMAKVEIKILRKALEATNWNRKKASVLLNISYKSMLNKIKEYGLA